jgi:hypothetical protein
LATGPGVQNRVSLAELDVPRPDEAVAIVREVCRQYAAGELRGIPNATVIRLTHDGRILVEGPVNRDLSPVPAAAALLDDLLPGFNSPTGYKVPGGLRLVLARATRSIDLPPFAEVGEFSAALARFAAPDLGGVVRTHFQGWAARRAAADAPPAPPELTISDVRRARRATGLSLEDVAQAAAIPAEKLRELEWGYLRNWPDGAEGRDQLGRYARAAGLDEDVVVSVAWPLIESAEREAPVPAPAKPDTSPIEDAPGTWALVPAPSRALAAPLAWPVKTPPHVLLRYRWAIAVAAAILLVTATLIAGWDRLALVAAPAVPRIPPPAAREAAAPRPLPATVVPPEIVSTQARVRPATLVRPAEPRRAAKPQARKASQPRKTSFFKRELFRIVIR